MNRLARGILSLSLFALFGAGALVLSAAMLILGRPDRCHPLLRWPWRALLWLFEAFRLVRVDRSGIPDCRGCVVVASHPSLIDVVILVALVPRVLPVAKHGLKGNPFVSLIVRNACLPDDETLPEVSRPYLEKGWNVLVFPEGTRSPASGVGRFRRGAMQVALRCGAPVVCVSLRQSRRILGKDQKPWDMGERTVVYSTACKGPMPAVCGEGESLHAAASRLAREMHDFCRGVPSAVQAPCGQQEGDLGSTALQDRHTGYSPGK